MIPAHRAILHMRLSLAGSRSEEEREMYTVIVVTMVERHGEPSQTVASGRFALSAPVDLTGSDRDSVLPPVLAGNQETRATASKHFQETRRILAAIR